MRITAIALIILVLIPTTASAYVGTLVSTSLGILGTGNWIITGPTRISWDVHYDNAASNWFYSYDFMHPLGATSHLILEASTTFTSSDLLCAAGDFGGTSIGWFGPGGSNPNMPGSMYGIKFDDASGLFTHIEFRTLRAPVWGDFYARDGVAGGYGWNTAWNAGFTDPDTDPIAPPMDGSIDNHLLVPDTTETPAIPEPSTLLLLGSALLGVAAYARRRR